MSDTLNDQSTHEDRIAYLRSLDGRRVRFYFNLSAILSGNLGNMRLRFEGDKLLGVIASGAEGFRATISAFPHSSYDPADRGVKLYDDDGHHVEVVPEDA